MNTSPREYLLTVDDLAHELDLSPQRVRDLMRSGELPGFRKGKRWYTLKRDWVRHIERMAKNGGVR